MRQDKSTDQQLTELEAYCKQYNLIHRHQFVDKAKSGKSTAGRDDFNRMISEYEIPENRPRGLLLWNYARFARDIDDAQFNKIRIRQWGTVIHSLNDQIPEGGHGRIIEFFIDVANEEKRKQTSIDAKRGLKDLVEKYGCVPGTPPRGFKRTPVNLGTRRDKTEHIAHRWDPDPDWIPRVQRAFSMKAAGATLLEIHKETHIYGSLNSYRTFFSNKIYIGILEFGELTIENYCEPIIDLPTWDAVQKIQALHTDRQHVTNTKLHPQRRSSKNPYLLSGIAYCARCGSPLWGMSSGQRSGAYYYRYACTRAKRRRDCDLQPIPARALEQDVIKELAHFFEHPDNLRDLLEADRLESLELASKQKEISKDLQKQLTTLRRSIANITNAIAESGHSKSMLQKLSALEAEETDLQTRLGSVKTQTPTVEPVLMLNEITLLARSMLARLQTHDHATLRRVLLSTIRQVKVDRTATRAYGSIQLRHHPRETKTPSEESPAIITASLSPAPLWAYLHRRSISFEFTINSIGKSRSG